jgi:Ca2+-binding RTX toxin-like protein
MANFQGTSANDLLQGTIADDLYIDLGVGVDSIRDPGGKNTIDISTASTGAIVDLSPGKTSTLGTGSFTLGSLVVGNNPDVIFVADISGSTFSRANGVAVGDLNKDGSPDTILDGEIAGFIALNQSLIDRGLGDTARISLVAFDDTAKQVGTTVTPKTDANSNGIYDIVENLQSLQISGSTNYQAALIQAQTIFKNLNTPSGKGNLVFLSDGAPNGPDYKSEVATLKSNGYNLSAFGVGDSIPLAPLQVIDPNAKTFTTTTQLVSAFTLQGGTGSSTETSIENFIGTKFDDKISGNILSNKIDAGAGDDLITGVNPNNINPGKGEIDILTGSTGKDTFVLGDSNKLYYYDDGDATTPGIADYALITDFNSTEGDIVKLSGSISQYSLDNSPIAGINGQALFLDKPTGEPRELIAIFQNSTGLTIDTILNGFPKIQIAKGIDGTEASTNGNFILTRTGDITNSLTVNLDTTTGSATSGVDYQAIAQTVTFAAGSLTATVDVLSIDDTIVETNETISLSLATGSGYILGAVTTAEINLSDNDIAPPPAPLPSITISQGIDVSESNINGSFILTRTGDITNSLTVNLDTTTGSATSGVDYQAIAQTVTFAAGSLTATVDVVSIDDTIVETNETISLSLATGNGYTLGAVTTAEINLIDNDIAPPPVNRKNIIKGDGNDNILNGTQGNDKIYALGGNDIVYGNAGNDIIDGGNGNDKLFGGDGNDKIFGGCGNDIIDGVKSNSLTQSSNFGKGEIDILTGGAGKDVFVLGMASDAKNSLTGGKYYVGEGNCDYALIKDFNLGKKGDAIQLFGNANDYKLASVDAGLPGGVGIYTNDTAHDLVGIIQGCGVSTCSLNLTNTAQFTFVS